MNSENLYRLSKLKLEGQKFGTPSDRYLLKTYYECNHAFHFETAFFIPCHINSIGRYVYGKELYIKREAIQAYDILYVYDGELALRYKNRSFTVSKNDLVFIHTDACYEITVNSGERVDVLFLSNNGLITKEYYHLIMQNGFKPIHIKNPDVLDSIFEKILFYMSYPSTPNNALATEAIMRLFTELYLNAINTDEYDQVYGHPAWFVKAIAFIDQNYNRNIVIKEMAESCGFSASHLFKLFGEYTGKSPYSYLLNVRINKAKTLLLNTGLPVKYISHTIGFKSPNHFITHFKKITGTTPELFRKQYGEQS